MLKNKKILCVLFILYSIQFIGQENKSISFVKKGQVEKITIRQLSAFLENIGVKNTSKHEYFFDKDGLLTKEIDSLFNSTTYYYYTKKKMCEKTITKTENKIKFITTIERTDSCIIYKTVDSLSLLLFTSEVKVNSMDKIIYKKTIADNDYIEIITFDYDENMLPIKSTYWSEGMDYKTDIHYKDVIKDKHGNWIKCASSSDLLFKEQTISIREIIYR